MIERLIFTAVAALLVCLSRRSAAQEPTFDLHVHLRNGAQSVAEYEAQAASAKRQVTAFGGMWFGGPNQALAGQPARMRAQNDALLAVAAKEPKLLPIATVHPYDGKAALDELTRLATLGIKILKLHPHTQKFDVTDARVLTLAQRAGALGVIVLLDNANITAGDSENLFLAADSPIEAEFVWTLRNVGVDHVLLGSDYPQFTLAQTLGALERLDLDQKEKAKIRYENARRLLKR